MGALRFALCAYSGGGKYLRLALIRGAYSVLPCTIGRDVVSSDSLLFISIMAAIMGKMNCDEQGVRLQ